MEEYYPIRLEMYTKRKLHMLSTLRKQMKILKNKSRFIQWISSGQINLLNKTKV